MSRAFTVHFGFKGKNYTALVSFNSLATEETYLVKYLDEDIDQLIPGKRLLVSISGSIEDPKLRNEASNDLVGKTKEAIKGYLQSH